MVWCEVCYKLWRIQINLNYKKSKQMNLSLDEFFNENQQQRHLKHSADYSNSGFYCWNGDTWVIFGWYYDHKSVFVK